jgi:3-carboxy-cis,cis-muconate cycloisomerase
MDPSRLETDPVMAIWVNENGRPTEPAGLFDAVQAKGLLRHIVSDRAWLAALIEVEAALARAEAAAGVIPADAANAIVAACAGLTVDLPALSADTARTGTPVYGLVRQLRAAVPPAAAEFVHKGATSQDIVDTAAMVLARKCLTYLLLDLHLTSQAAAQLANSYRDTPMAGRTLLRQAMPTTFGLKAAGWMVALDECKTWLGAIRDDRLAVQFGGAAGTWAGLDGAGADVTVRLAAELHLTVALLPWHTNRTRPAELAGALGQLCGVVAKVARDVTLLSQNEIAEVSEGSPGASSAMAHKRNPVAAISAAACAAQAPGLVATILASMAHEHERAAGSWQAEWRPLRDLLTTTGSAVSWLRSCLEQLDVHPARMKANLTPLLRELKTRSPDLGSAVSMVDSVLSGRP